MPARHEDVDTLLAEVNALADEAVAEIVGESTEAVPPPAGPASAQASPGRTPQPPAGPPPSSAPPPSVAGENTTRILHLEVPVIVQLAQNTMPLSGILGLTTGAIIEFDKPADGELALLINNKCIARGLAVKVGENFGLRITQIGSVRERIAALGTT